MMEIRAQLATPARLVHVTAESIFVNVEPEMTVMMAMPAMDWRPAITTKFLSSAHWARQ
jgi:hypothetical protein